MNGTAQTKKTYRIRLKKQEVFGMAGLWSTWRSPDGKKVSAFTIITRKQICLWRRSATGCL